MTKHTKEPWFESNGELHGASGLVTYIHGIVPYEHDEANANRIVACVNALAGVKDPEGLMRDMRGAIEALDMEDGATANQKGADHLDAIRKHLKPT